MKVALILTFLSTVLFAQVKISVTPAVSTTVDLTPAVTSVIQVVTLPIKLCRYPNLGAPCFEISKDTTLSGTKWSTGEPINGIGSVQVSNNYYRAVFVKVDNGVETTKTVKKEDGVVNLQQSIKYHHVDAINPPLKICLNANNKGTCEYLWNNVSSFKYHSDYSQFYKKISSFTVAQGYEATLCTEPFGRGTCQNYINYNQVNNFSFPAVSIYVWKYDAGTPLKLCWNKNLKGICVQPSEGDIDIFDGKGVSSARYRSMYLAKGYEATVCAGKYLANSCLNLEGPLLYEFQDDFQFRSYELRVKFSNWYRHTYQPNFPHDAEVEWGYNTSQGVTHNDKYWYFSTEDKLMKYPITQRLTQGSPMRKIHLPHSCEHFGDIDYYQYKIYVPLEKCKGGSEKGRRIYVYDTHLNMIKYGYLSGVSNASWVAINPVNGLMYSSVFYNGKYGKMIDVYDPDFKSGTTIKKLYQVELSHGIKRIQGGAISKNGNLYLVSDNRYSTRNAGIYMYRIEGKKARFVHKIETNGFSPGFPHYEEMEGMTLWNLDNKNISGIPRGHIHWVLNVNDAYYNDLYFKHITVDNPDNL